MAPASARRLLGLTRMAVAVSALLSPRATAWAFGIDHERSNDFVTRLFGSRELFLATYLLLAPPEQLRQAATIGAVIDSVDVISSVVEYGAGRMSPYTAVTGGGGAALFAVLGLIVARADETA